MADLAACYMCTFCNKCGKVDKMIKAHQYVCPDCGTLQPDGARACPVCNRPLPPKTVPPPGMSSA